MHTDTNTLYEDVVDTLLQIRAWREAVINMPKGTWDEQDRKAWDVAVSAMVDELAYVRDVLQDIRN